MLCLLYSNHTHINHFIPLFPPPPPHKKIFFFFFFFFSFFFYSNNKTINSFFHSFPPPPLKNRFFLFNDLLAYASVTNSVMLGNRYKLHNQFSLSDSSVNVRVINLPDGINENEHYMF